jgi:hypothetical protein
MKLYFYFILNKIKKFDGNEGLNCIFIKKIKGKCIKQ